MHDDLLTLKKILFTLNDISVKGKNDLDKLLACIVELEKVIEREGTPNENSKSNESSATDE